MLEKQARKKLKKDERNSMKLQNKLYVSKKVLPRERRKKLKKEKQKKMRKNEQRKRRKEHKNIKT